MCCKDTQGVSLLNVELIFGQEHGITKNLTFDTYTYFILFKF